MRKTSSSDQACAGGCYIQRDRTSEDLAGADYSSLALSTRPKPSNSWDLGRSGMLSSPTQTPGPHGQRRSADFSRRRLSSVIVVKKKRGKPKPPQRSMSLPQPVTASRPSFKRYSCPPTGPCRPSSYLYSSYSSMSSSSSSSLSSLSSCSSSPALHAVPTSAITGPDPLGWKLQPKFSSASRRAKRLSLQIPLLLVLPHPETNPPTGSQVTQKPPLRAKPPHRRRHSDSSAFLGRRAVPMPAVTPDELSAARLSLAALPPEFDDVFHEEREGMLRLASPLRRQKTAPPVAEKTSAARQKAKLITHSNRSSITAEENIYACVVKPKANQQHQIEKLVSLQERFTGKHLYDCLYIGNNARGHSIFSFILLFIT